MQLSKQGLFLFAHKVALQELPVDKRPGRAQKGHVTQPCAVLATGDLLEDFCRACPALFL